MSDTESYINFLSARLTGDRFRHSLNVADSAVCLARRYGADTGKAYVAGLLHDVMKDTGSAEQREAIEKGGYALTECERLSPKLTHAVAGAALIETELHLRDAEIVGAVRYHTTGRAGMSLLERVVFTADYISADRSYEGVEKMRALAEKSLEDAMLFGLAFTIMSLACKGGLIHPDSVACYNELTAQKILKA